MISLKLTQEQFDNWTKYKNQVKNINGGFRNVISPTRRQSVIQLYKKYECRQKPIVRDLKMGAATVRRILQEEGVIV